MMEPTCIQPGDPVKASSVGPGVVTDITDAGFPRVNHIAVAWMEREDGVVFDPHGVRWKGPGPNRRSGSRPAVPSSTALTKTTA